MAERGIDPADANERADDQEERDGEQDQVEGGQQ
jgi:hypothetical protein